MRMSQEAASASPAPSAGPFNGRDHGLGAFADGVEAFAHAADVLEALALGLAHGLAAADVGAGGEDLAGAGEDRHAHVVAVADDVESLGDLGGELRVLRIDRRRVHGDDGDVILDVDLDEGRGHGILHKLSVILGLGPRIPTIGSTSSFAADRVRCRLRTQLTVASAEPWVLGTSPRMTLQFVVKATLPMA